MFNKICSWWKGELIIVNTSIYNGAYYKQPLIAKFIKTTCLFSMNHWAVLFPTILAAGVALFIHFDSKTSSKPKQEKDHQQNIIIHKLPIKKTNKKINSDHK